jgi:hypothetical protein
MSAPLRLRAEDAEDLGVISSALQDAIGKIGEISYDAGARRLTLAFNRFRWEAGAKTDERVRCGLQLGGVMGVQQRKLRRDARKAVIELLAITFEPGEAPGGAILFTFAGGGDLRAQVECIDVVAADLSEPWAATQRPSHAEG